MLLNTEGKGVMKGHVTRALPVVNLSFSIINNSGLRILGFGTTQSDGTGREEGGGFRMGNTCIPVADSC